MVDCFEVIYVEYTNEVISIYLQQGVEGFGMRCKE